MKSIKYFNFRETFKDRAESQEELFKILEKSFGKEEKINLKTFLNITENVCSEFFIYILIFLMESRPFTKETLNNYDVTKKNIKEVSKSPQITTNKLIASPSLQSKFSPCVTISKSPAMSKKSLGFDNTNNDKKDMLMKLAGKPIGGTQPQTESKSVLLKYAGGGAIKTEDTDEGVGAKNVPVSRKNRNNLRNIENIEKTNKSIQKNDLDIDILPAHKIKSKESNLIKNEELEKMGNM